MSKKNASFDTYYAHLSEISFVGRLYKRYFVAPLLYLNARRFGRVIVEIGSGVGSGLLGAFPNKVTGLEINHHAVKYCQDKGMSVDLIEASQPYPKESGSVDACVLDNVLEHISDADSSLKECSRITRKNGGLIIAVPGIKGFAYDDDHQVFYDESKLQKLHPEWSMLYCFSTPFIFKSNWLSKHIRQYCLVAIYKKN
ncbi:MAG: methyltransferase domain-containing protein [Pseudomonadota bacterium]